MSKIVYFPPPQLKPKTREEKLRMLADLHRVTADLYDYLRQAETVTPGKSFDEAIGRE